MKIGRREPVVVAGGPSCAAACAWRAAGRRAVGRCTSRETLQLGMAPAKSANRKLRLALCAVGIAVSSGCTRESLRIALEAQRRADQVQQAVFDQQHEALRVLLYRDLLRRLGETGLEVTEAQRAAINEVWNDRDLLEFWAVQQERARALRLVGVDAKLAGDQSVVDLLIKAARTRVDRVRQRMAGQAGAAAASRLLGGSPGAVAGDGGSGGS